MGTDGKNFWERNEAWWHRLMGFGAEVVNLGLLLDRRESKQLPPANDRWPEMWVGVDSKGLASARRVVPSDGDYDVYDNDGEYVRRYWGSGRVKDSLSDLHQYAQGATAGWFVVLGAGILIGWGIWG